MKIELLNPKIHNRNQFDCGVDVLNEYLRHFANQDSKKNLSRIHVLADKERIIGYYSISSHSVLTSELPDNQSKYSYSMVLPNVKTKKS